MQKRTRAKFYLDNFRFQQDDFGLDALIDVVKKDGCNAEKDEGEYDDKAGSIPHA
jgi:hypothetical protein